MKKLVLYVVKNGEKTPLAVVGLTTKSLATMQFVPPTITQLWVMNGEGRVCQVDPDEYSPYPL